MGVLDTTYTFTATDIVTSAKLNNVIDQTTFTSSAFSGTTLAINGSGQLRVNASGITSLELADNSVITAKITDANVTTAKILNANVTQAKLASNTVGNGPAFRAYANSVTSLANTGFTKVTLDLENFDTNGNFSSSTFTPTVAGYYQINATVSTSSSGLAILAILRKNGGDHSYGSGQVSSTAIRSSVSDIIEMNGTTDYIELFAFQNTGNSINSQIGSNTTYMSGCLIRSS